MSSIALPHLLELGLPLWPILGQVWSLMYIILLTFTIQDWCKKCFYKHTIKVCVSCFWWCPGPLRLERHTWHCSYISVVPEATNKACRGPLKGTESAQKSPSRVRNRDEGVVGEQKMQFLVIKRFVINLPSRHIDDFFYKNGDRKKIEIVARPVSGPSKGP